MKLFVLPLIALLATMAGAAQAGQESTTQDVYFDLVFGYCMQTVLGEPLREYAFDPASNWDEVVDFEGSERVMNERKSEVNLRSYDSDEGNLLVDIENRETCWTQADHIDAATLAARIRLFVLDNQLDGQILDEKLDRQASGDLSRLTLLSFVDWPGDQVPVFYIREMLDPEKAALTVQVIAGQKQER